ncbi:hypothetical protein A6V29_01060 [Blastococcus sp. CCUG 61487]|nr:hypothetical protein A6V29_01060 [Blastococcus sp. CCUG 61487]
MRVGTMPSADHAQQAVFVSVEEPATVPGFGRYYPFDGDPALVRQFEEDPPSCENMRVVGTALLDELARHEATQAALRYALDHTPPDESCPVYLDLEGSEAAAAIPWEALFEPSAGFLALQDRWPIARRAASTAPERGVRTFTAPIRLMAVMSAIGVSAAREWAALRRALRQSPGGVGVTVSVWVGEEALATQIEADLADDGLSGSVQYLTGANDLVRALKEFDPHLLHLFCHGRGGVSPFLLLATKREHEVGHGSSVVLEPLQLHSVGRSTWLISLNACEGASDSAGARSLAYLLTRAGCPAVVGMREPVSSAVAAVFTYGFYAALLGQLRDKLVPGQEVDLELAAALAAPRRDLRDTHQAADPTAAAAVHRDWTLPVLYVRRDPLVIEQLVADPSHDAQTQKDSTDYLDILLRFRREHPPGTAADVLAMIDAEIDRALEALRSPSR